jgi:hypothetical protein
MHEHWKTTLSSLLIAVTSSTITPGDETLEPVPALLVGTVEPIEFPDPICSKCTIIVIEDEASESSTASIAITYPADAPAFSGSLEVMVLLEDEQRRTLWLDDVSLEPSEAVALVADSGPDWTWREVCFVWLRFLPA